MKFIFSLAVISSTALGCARSTPLQQSQAQDWPTDWDELTGKVIVLEGRATNPKMGPVLVGEQNSIWIDLPSWPAEIDTDSPSSTRLRVSGKVIRRADVPVFLHQEGQQDRAGIPVATVEE